MRCGVRAAYVIHNCRPPKLRKNIFRFFYMGAAARRADFGFRIADYGLRIDNGAASLSVGNHLWGNFRSEVIMKCNAGAVREPPLQWDFVINPDI